MNSTMRSIIWGVLPLGNLAGGIFAESLGIRNALFIAGAGSLLAVLWLLLSRIRTLTAAEYASQEVSPTAS